jgi:intein-encoded DNA endonuclease-like protein
MDINLFYFTGALRDGSIDFRERKNYELRIYQDDERFLLNIKKILRKMFRTKVRIKNNLLRMNGKNTIKRIIELTGFKSPQVFWDTPEFIKKGNRKQIWYYVGGFFDAEGGVPKKTNGQKYISFDQKNKDCLIFIRDFLLKEGFNPTNLTNTGKVWQFRLTRKKEIKKFYINLISFHSKKRVGFVK